MKQIQISESLFLMLVQFHLGDYVDCKQDIDAELEKKLNTIINRNLYTKYKIAATKEEQEKARVEYLDQKGYYKDFRW